MTESMLYKKLKAAWGGLFHFMRFETGMTAKGIPDVYYHPLTREFSGWIELKIGVKNADGSVSVKYRPGQRKTLSNLQKGCDRVFTLIQVEDEFFLVNRFEDKVSEFIWSGKNLKEKAFFVFLFHGKPPVGGGQDDN